METQPVRDAVKSIRDFGLLRATALVAATVISFEAESSLARLAGISASVAFFMPVAIDALMIAALRSRRPWAVGCAALMMGTANASSHLLAPGESTVKPGIIAAVSVVPVLVLLLLELLVPAANTSIPGTPTVEEWRKRVMWEIPFNAVVPTPEEAAESYVFNEPVPAAEPEPAPVTVPDEDTEDSDEDTHRGTPSVAAMKAAEARIVDSGKEFVGRTIGEHFGVSTRTGSRYLKAFKKATSPAQ